VDKAFHQAHEMYSYPAPVTRHSPCPVMMLAIAAFVVVQQAKGGSDPDKLQETMVVAVRTVKIFGFNIGHTTISFIRCLAVSKPGGRARSRQPRPIILSTAGDQ